MTSSESTPLRPSILRSTRRAIMLAACATIAIAGTAHAALGTASLRGAQVVPGSSGSGFRPVVAQSTAGPSIVWEESGSGILVSDFRKRSWVRAVRVPGALKGGEFPALAVSANGHAVLAWVAGDAPNAGRIAVSYRAPGADSFAKPTYFGNVAGGAVSYVGPTVAVNASGRAVVAWTRHGEQPSVEVAYGTRARFGAASTLAGNASWPKVAIDDAGRAVLMHMQFVGDAVQLRQYLAPANAGFGAGTTVDATASGESGARTGLSLVSNRGGRIAAAWGSLCGDCPQVFSARFGVGTTSAGITNQREYRNLDKHADTAQAAIDEAGNASAAFDGIDGIGVAHATAGGAFSPEASTVALSNGVVDPEVNLQAVNGEVVVSWRHSPEAGARSAVHAREAAFPAAGSNGTWGAARQLTRAGHDADWHMLVARPGNVMLAYRSGGRMWTDTNAPRDRTKPNMTLPRPRVRLAASGNAFRVRMTCARSEASCEGTVRATTRVRSGRRMRTVTIGTATFYARGGRTVVARVSLNRTGRALTRRGAPTVTTRLAVSVRDAAGNRRTLTRTVRVVPPRR